MAVRVFDDLATFWAHARRLYLGDPVRHDVAVILAGQYADSQVTGKPYVLVTAEEGGRATSAVMATPGRPVLLTALARWDLEDVAVELHRRRLPVAGVQGSPEVAERFARLWAGWHGTKPTVAMRQRLYALGALAAPSGVPGGASVATRADVREVTAMTERFAHEAFGVHQAQATGDWQEVARESVDSRGPVLWRVGAATVAQAVVRTPYHGVTRIGYVYTVPEHRGRGYAAAVTSAACDRATELGAEHIVLLTDRENPTSNAVYRRIGFRYVHDTVEYAFTEPSPD